jgi:hypothetical protein
MRNSNGGRIDEFRGRAATPAKVSRNRRGSNLTGSR